MNPNIRILHHLAKKWGLPFKYHTDGDVLEITLAKKHYYFFRSRTFLNEGGGIYIAGNKYVANQVLEKSGFSVSKSTFFTNLDYQNKQLKELIGDLTFPLVAKPLKNTGRGTAVFSKIKDIQTLNIYLERFFRMYDAVVLEEFQGNLNEYRVVVLNNKVLAILSRTGASVIGDGIHTIEELISIKNEERLKQMQTLTISPLVFDEEYQHCLDEVGLNLQHIPAKNKKIRLSYTANTGRGGDIYTCSTKINPQNTKTLIDSVHTLGLVYGGIDLLCEDLDKPFDEQRWIIIEINSCPDLSIHQIPNTGKNRPVAHLVLWELIKKHPFAYLKHGFKTGNISFYLKILFCVIGLLFILYSIE